MRPKKYKFSYIYNNKNIEYLIYVKGIVRKINKVLLLGTLQTGRAARTVTSYLSPGTAVVQGAPHWLAKPDGSDIPEFMYKFTKNVINIIIKLSDNKKFSLIAESQAAPGAINYSRSI